MSDNWPRIDTRDPEDVRRFGRVVDVYKSRQPPTLDNGKPKDGEWEHYDWSEELFADARRAGWTDSETSKNLAALNRLRAEDELRNPAA